MTQTVAPRTSAPAASAARRAMTSACGPPGTEVLPEATTVGDQGLRVTAQPTRGLGSVVPSTDLAASKDAAVTRPSVTSVAVALPAVGPPQIDGHSSSQLLNADSELAMPFGLES